MGDSSTNSVGQNPPFICSTTSDYTFCAPKKSGDFYLAVNPTQPAQKDVERIRSWFGSPYVSPQPVSAAPAGIVIPGGARIYNVTNFLPRIVTARNGTLGDFPGPNCYHATLTALGYPDVHDRYVDTDEFRYYLKRDFTQASCRDAPFGSVIVYNPTYEPQQYDAGIHAAFHLLGALVFQKGLWETHYPYEIATIEGAMQAANSHWRPRREDRFGGDLTKPDPKLTYKFLCYQKRKNPLPRATSSTKKDRTWFLPLMQYYSRRIEEASKLMWSEFPSKRIDLLTIENMWRVKREFRTLDYNPIDVLLSIDDAVVSAYLKLVSLSWQYQAISDTYDPIREGISKQQWEKRYREHYVTFDSNFYNELKLYLKLLEVPEKKWESIIQYVVKKIKTYDPVQFSQSNGTLGIPYFDILKEAIQAN